MPGARWYAWHRREILTGPGGTWAIDLYLGGPSGTRHQIRIGVVDTLRHTDLTEFLRSQAGQPLETVPAGFFEEVRITVTRE